MSEREMMRHRAIFMMFISDGVLIEKMNRYPPWGWITEAQTVERGRRWHGKHPKTGV